MLRLRMVKSKRAIGRAVSRRRPRIGGALTRKGYEALLLRFTRWKTESIGTIIYAVRKLNRDA